MRRGEYLYPEMENDYFRIEIISFNVLDETTRGVQYVMKTHS